MIEKYSVGLSSSYNWIKTELLGLLTDQMDTVWEGSLPAMWQKSVGKEEKPDIYCFPKILPDLFIRIWAF